MSTDEREKIEGCYCETYRAMISKDLPALSAVLDESFVLVHMTGMRQSKDAFLNAVGNGTLNYFAADHENIRIQQNGERALLVGQSRVLAAVFGGGRHIWRLQQKIELVKRDGVWQMTLAEASTY